MLLHIAFINSLINQFYQLLARQNNWFNVRIYSFDECGSKMQLVRPWSTASTHIFDLPPVSHHQISNVRVDPVSTRPEKKNILHGSTTESLLGKTRLAALTKPFMVHLKNGKLRALALPLLALVMNFSVLLDGFQPAHNFLHCIL